MNSPVTDRDAADGLLLLAAACTVAELLAQIETLTKERDDAVAIARLNQQTLIGLVAGYDEERRCIEVDPDPGCLECTANTTPIDRTTGPCAYHRARKITHA